MNNNKKRKVFVVSNYGYSNYPCWMNVVQVPKMEDADFVVLEGGSDVNPIYYNQPNSGHSHVNASYDAFEWDNIQKAIKLKLPIVGICKGHQFLTAAAGGALFQDVRHSYFHKTKIYDGQTLYFNSLHHQMADVSKLKEGEDYKLLAWTENLSPIHIDAFNENKVCVKEPESLFFPKINGLGFQNHFEMMYADAQEYDGKERSAIDDSINWAKDTLNKFLNGKL